MHLVGTVKGLWRHKSRVTSE